MYGVILFYWPDAAGDGPRGVGLLKDLQGKTYLFHDSALPPDLAPHIGDQVEFDAAQVMGRDVATRIYPLQR